MRRAIVSVLLLAASLSLASCKILDKITHKGASDSATPSSESSSSSGFSSSGSIGVAECDDFIRNYKACLSDKIPADSRSAFEGALSQNESLWRQYAASPERRETLAESCREASETAANSLQAYGCSF
jgi:hypothetical protein